MINHFSMKGFMLFEQHFVIFVLHEFANNTGKSATGFDGGECVGRAIKFLTAVALHWWQCGQVEPEVAQGGPKPRKGDPLITGVKYPFALRTPPGMGLDPRTGELAILIGSADAPAGTAALKTRLEAIAGVPVQVRVLNHVDVNLAPEGGSRVEGVSPADGRRYLCTTGFTVTDGIRYGVTTAAHCVDDLVYRDPQAGSTPLPFVGQWGWGYRDVQINAADAPLPPTFYADTARTRLRPVTGERGRASTRAGDFVCHRGERTGYSCALVQLTDFAPAGDLCGGACLPTWVTVAGPTCKGGDSGSPVFSGTTALGVLKGASYRGDGSCVFYFYMSVDYLPPGWQLLKVPPLIQPLPAPDVPVSSPAGTMPGGYDPAGER